LIAISKSGVVLGVNAFPIEVEVDVSPGLPAFNIVGLPENSVKESRERVKSSIKNSGFPFPTQKITVNLAPADIKKDGTGLDLPIAAAILCSIGILPQDKLHSFSLLGELSLDGTIRATRGILPFAIGAENWDLKGIVVPEENAKEASIVKNISVFPVKTLREFVQFFLEEIEIKMAFFDNFFDNLSDYHFYDDFSDVIGQSHAKRALEVAAAGGHNVLMVGPPGSGKTMLSKRLPSILPPLTFEEAIETTSIYSVAGLLDSNTSIIRKRPFCAPHHTISDAGLIGGGAIPRPGQVSLSHNGILFLDELPEFKKNVLEGLRQPIEDGVVTISRSALTLSFPARFTLIASQNPCPCGHLGDSRKQCVCTQGEIIRYRNKISGPLLDRLDIQIEVPAVSYEELSSEKRGESSTLIRERVLKAREIQQKRFSGRQIYCNAQMGAKEIREYCHLTTENRAFLEKMANKFSLSARAYHRIIKISRTIADLEGASHIALEYLAEAVQYRSLDRGISSI